MRPYPFLLAIAACALLAAQVHGEAGELALKVHELGAAVGQQHARLLVDLESALGKPLLGRIDSLTAKPMWPLVPRPFCFMTSISESLKYETGVSITGRPIIVENSSAISRASAGSVALMPTWATRMPKSSTGLAFCSFIQAAPTEP